VNKFVRISTMSLVIVLGLASVALAQNAPNQLIVAGSAVGVGLTVIGAAYGIGRLAGSALESMARQPEVAGSIQTAMIIAAALIEGFTFFALYICMTQRF
jgi:F-type H+-transporting ATPase subunit c